jgi:hypothetical protein
MKFGRKKNAADRLQTLARKIEATAKKDKQRLREIEEITKHRSRGALDLHAICSEFVGAVNQLLPAPMVELSPSEYSGESFRDPGSNVFQISVSGRIVHIEFRATDALTSTEKFRTPYVLEGSLRAFNQESLDLAIIPEQLLFYCMGATQVRWLWFDPRTQRTGPLQQEHLISLLDRLL